MNPAKRGWGASGFDLNSGVELHRDVPRMRRQLHDLDELAVVRSADNLEAGFGQRAVRTGS
jgi:hypothetical protein